ncbi:MAG: YdgA family protein [Gammaproteobacteria bacterium]|nr:YdgA family protein [Gammaproteobacteria bacterium]MCW9003766.1 YdgA family protein [Gammaproteobacteria bacterium]
MTVKRISAVEIVLWFSAFILLLLVVSPFVLGFKIKNDYASVVTDVSDLIQADIQIISYERGFFSSNVMLNIGLNSVPFKFQLREKIIHGPIYLGLINQGKSPFVAAVASGELLPPVELSTQIKQLFSDKSPLVYQNVINFTGGIVSESYIPAINTVIKTDPGEVKVTSSGVTMTSAYSPQAGRLSGEANMPVFSLMAEAEKIDIKDLNLNYSGIVGENGLLIGDSMLTLGLLDYHSNGDQLSVRLFNIQTMTNEQGQFMNSQLQMNAQEILASDVKLGPVAFNVSVNGLDASKLHELQAIQKEMEQKLQQGIPNEQVTAMYAGQMMGLLPDLLKQSEIKVHPLKVESELGTLTSDMTFSIEGLDASAPADPLFILNALNLDMNLQIDEALLRQMIKWELMSNDQLAAGNEAARQAEKALPVEQKVNENIRGLLDEDWLTVEDRVYHSNLSFHQGQMLLNGKSIDPVAHFMSQMAPPAAENSVSP